MNNLINTLIKNNLFDDNFVLTKNFDIFDIFIGVNSRCNRTKVRVSYKENKLINLLSRPISNYKYNYNSDSDDGNEINVVNDIVELNKINETNEINEDNLFNVDNNDNNDLNFSKDSELYKFINELSLVLDIDLIIDNIMHDGNECDYLFFSAGSFYYPFIESPITFTCVEFNDERRLNKGSICIFLYSAIEYSFCECNVSTDENIDLYSELIKNNEIHIIVQPCSIADFNIFPDVMIIADVRCPRCSNDKNLKIKLNTKSQLYSEYGELADKLVAELIKLEDKDVANNYEILVQPINEYYELLKSKKIKLKSATKK